ncbi:MAG TPA: GntR family transcriptional regulator [Kofleriaceae bacterium]|nr:GntR family transcriptional regulator [Kofleriaceae bacterium]
MTLTTDTITTTTPGGSHGTAIESVLETLLADIMRGTYPPGARLPAERELSKILGASRPTLREALRRLGEWQLVEPRRGSGIVVRPLADWSIEVLPAYLRYARPSPLMPTTGRLLLDLLALRRVIIRDIAMLVTPRLTGGNGTAQARVQLQRAWGARNAPAQFVREDFLVMRAVVEAAGFLPAVWMLNRVAGVYVEIAAAVTNQVRVPDDYLDSSFAYLDAIDAGDADKAGELVSAYLERHDAALTRALEMIA